MSTAQRTLALALLAAWSASAQTAPKVTGVTGVLELDHKVEVQIDHLAEWAATNDVRKLVPYLNGRALPATYPEAMFPGNNAIQFHLERNAESKETWNDLLREPTPTRMVTLSVGIEGQPAFDTALDRDHRVKLIIMPTAPTVVSLLSILLLLALFIVLARRTDIIRDSGPALGTGKRRPYNLGKTQMAFWFFLIFSAYVVLWVITGDLDTITTSLLGLMGISAGTAVSDALIESGKKSAATQQAENAATAVAASAAAAGQTAVVQVTSDGSTASSAGFLQDVLQDSHGYSFHRFQIFAWTIVLGIVFIAAVYEHLSMPEFSGTMLGLMGISAGTYLGFRIPEE